MAKSWFSANVVLFPCATDALRDFLCVAVQMSCLDSHTYAPIILHLAMTKA